MTETPPPSKQPMSRSRKAGKQAARITTREYLPMTLTIGFWALAAVVIGHPDAARLLAATVMIRAAQMLVGLNTSAPLMLRATSPREVRRQSRRTARWLQLGSLGGAVVMIALAYVGLRAIGQDEMAALLPLAALGLPARAIRLSDFDATSPYFRVALGAAGLAGAGLGWLAGAGLAGIALAYGAREWIALLVVWLWPQQVRAPTTPLATPLAFAEVARTTAVSGRRLLTYRLTKNILTVFGPFGNVAARTGRGLNWHSKIEPYMPHKLPGFILFALVSGGAGVALAAQSGEPVALIIAAGLLQLAAIATNIAAMWRWLPDRHDPNLVIAEDDED